ncbi:MAG: tRNA (adenosine(37)-N6)-dimethylallyltransferase MiaA [Rhodobacteraceae bacterium TMED111]|nr:tRNA (adenosine(37)-N6)-dimethylallyltransferase MiaA [Marinovum sp.]OUV43638.1 MAG: tRNA (adenosine(37)-N6)-dimethylallyltransferase MiaA [Rhodobacteraceae bacterium TMED111]
MTNHNFINQISSETPILISGQTASGKSQLALQIAEKKDCVIVNADAIQVFKNWRILTARPSISDEAVATHMLYGHIAAQIEYSVGHWLRDVQKILSIYPNPIIVGGTGLYFSSLTNGLIDIPDIPAQIRLEAKNRIQSEGFENLIAEIDPETSKKIDKNNPMRIQRAWEVMKATGRGLASWHRETPKPILELKNCKKILVDGDASIVNNRISSRFDQMLDNGLLEEASKNFSTWDEKNPSSKAIGAKELMAFLNDDISMEQLKEEVIVATRKYAKRQRTWFRSKMKSWIKLN